MDSHAELWLSFSVVKALGGFCRPMEALLGFPLFCDLQAPRSSLKRVADFTSLVSALIASVDESSIHNDV